MNATNGTRYPSSKGSAISAARTSSTGMEVVNGMESSGMPAMKPMPHQRVQQKQQSLQFIRVDSQVTAPKPDELRNMSICSKNGVVPPPPAVARASTSAEAQERRRRVVTAQSTTLEEHESGLFLPGDMSDELKELNVKVDRVQMDVGWGRS